MQLLISGKQVDVGEALRGHVQARVEARVAKYFERPIEGVITFSKHAHLYRTDCNVHAGTGIRVQAQAEDPDIYASLEAAVDRLETRLRRWKRRLKQHHGAVRPEAGPVLKARSYMFAAEAEDDEAAVQGLLPDAAPDTTPGTDSAASDADVPVIIAESTTEIRNLTVREAVMSLDLADLPVLMFRNQAHGGLNVVYRRADGHIGWIEPGPGAGSEPR